MPKLGGGVPTDLFTTKDGESTLPAACAPHGLLDINKTCPIEMKVRYTRGLSQRRVLLARPHREVTLVGCSLRHLRGMS